MPATDPLPEQIGQDVENQLIVFLNTIGLTVDDVEVIPEDLRLMNRGEQYGLDASWVIHFSDMGKSFNWYFEAKGHGFLEYGKKPRSKHIPFNIKLIADKLLKSLSLHGRDIHCWCLFAPYVSCDEGDLIELKQLAEHFPFKLIIWDKNFLHQKLPYVSGDLFSTLYFLDQLTLPTNPQVINSITKDIKAASYEGLFWNKVQKQYFSIRRSILSKCRRKIVFESDIQYGFSNEREIPRTFITTYKFIYEGDEFITNEENLSAAVNIEGVKKLLSSALNSQSISLSSKLKEFLDEEQNPYLQITLEHRSGDFKNCIPYYEINSSTNFGCLIDKPALIKVEEI